AADGRGQVVDVAQERVLHALLGLGLRTLCPGLEEGVLVFEEAPGLHLVVAEPRAEPPRVTEAGQQVATLLEDQDGVSRTREYPGGDASARPRPDHDHGALAHARPASRAVSHAENVAAAAGPSGGPGSGELTRAAENPAGWRSPCHRVDVHPTSFRFPPYSGGPYIASSVLASAAPTNS